MLNDLGVAWLSFVSAAIFPFLSEDNRPFLFPFCIPGTEDNLLFIMIDKRPAQCPIPTGSPPTLNKLFSIQKSPHGVVRRNNFLFSWRKTGSCLVERE
ncbi:hypothetical protein AB1E22_00405 [Buttiauxella gaviniae]|uniref:Secreted protein n=1 Tax=Buttiauxella gaviniae TaxID=82990 RepID=A0ABV3NPG7_9ENTR